MARSEPGLTRDEITAGLCRLGVRRGDLLEVHSSLGSLGWVQGGAATVIEALIEVVGPEGALVMPAIPVSLPVPLTDEEAALGITWKVRVLDFESPEPTGMGAIADTFRRRPDVVCGTQRYRTCAWGRDAQRYSEGFGALPADGGQVLLIGVGIQRCSCMHVAEDGNVPEEIRALLHPPEELAHEYPDDRWLVGYGPSVEATWLAVWEEAVRAGEVQTRQIGSAACHLFPAQAVVRRYAERLRIDPYAAFGL
jgi:aminoglycoside 3-N-acetyltransferase